MGWPFDDIKLPEIRFDNPINTVTDIVAAPFRAMGDLYDNSMREINNVVNPGDSALEQMGDQMSAKERGARAAAFQDAVSDRTVDNITMQEIMSLYQSGGSSDQIASLLANAREGKGIYAVRKINYQEQKIKQDQPGRQQVQKALGRGVVLG